MDKPEGATSFKSLGAVKRKLKEAAGKAVKVGHTGTLDKFASGLLVVLTGKYTRFNSIFTGLDKSYDAVIKFGEETDTLDPEGDIISVKDVPSYEEIEKACMLFSGSIEQMPPAYSAIHIDGKRAYQMARSGEVFDIPSRNVRIDRLEITDWNPPFLSVSVDCSKGTYIRSLARDIAAEAGSCGRLEVLRRTAVGPFRVEDAVRADDFNEGMILTGTSALRELSGYTSGNIGILNLKQEAIQAVRTGISVNDGMLTDPPPADGIYAVFSGEILAAAVERKKGIYSYIFVA